MRQHNKNKWNIIEHSPISKEFCSEEIITRKRNICGKGGISICLNKGTKKFTILLYLENKTLLEDLFHYCEKSNVPVKRWIDGCSIGLESTTNGETITNFMKIINQQISLKSIKKYIFNQIYQVECRKLKKYIVVKKLDKVIKKVHSFNDDHIAWWLGSDKEEQKEIKQAFYKRLKKFVKEGKFDQALKDAELSDDTNHVWKLGNYCKAQEKFDQAIKFYQAIPENNPHYAEANWQAAHIVVQCLDNQSNLPANEKCEYIEKIVRFLCRANKDSKVQTLLDRFLDQLAGGDGFNQTISNVKLGEDALVALIKEVAFLRNENRTLRDKNCNLNRKLTKKNAVKMLVQLNSPLWRNNLPTPARSVKSSSAHSFFNTKQINKPKMSEVPYHAGRRSAELTPFRVNNQN